MARGGKRSDAGRKPGAPKKAIDAAAEPTASEQRIGRPFEKGQSGNPAGRPKGSRNKLGEEFIQKLYADFQEHGEDAIVKVRTEKPEHYLKVIAGILPKELKITNEPI